MEPSVCVWSPVFDRFFRNPVPCECVSCMSGMDNWLSSQWWSDAVSRDNTDMDGDLMLGECLFYSSLWAAADGLCGPGLDLCHCTGRWLWYGPSLYDRETRGEELCCVVTVRRTAREPLSARYTSVRNRQAFYSMPSSKNGSANKLPRITHQ